MILELLAKTFEWTWLLQPQTCQKAWHISWKVHLHTTSKALKVFWVLSWCISFIALLSLYSALRNFELSFNLMSLSYFHPSVNLANYIEFTTLIWMSQLLFIWHITTLAGFAISSKTTGKSLLVHIQGNIVQVGFFGWTACNF